MGDFIDIAKHSKFHYRGDPLDLLKKKDEEEVEDKIPYGVSFCSECIHRVDGRPWYRRWFLSAKAKDYLCRVAPRFQVKNSVTGKPGFLPLGEIWSSRAESQPYHPCEVRNCTGNCRHFHLHAR